MKTQRGSKTRRRVLAVGAGLVLAGLALRPRGGEDLTGRRVLIAGGSKGLGLLLAREFSARGCHVAICARDEEELEWATGILAESGAERPFITVCDVSEREQVAGMLEAVTGALGGVDVLVNNAGVIQVGPQEAMALEDFETAMGTMYWGAVYPTLALLPAMMARGDGHIVNITSIGGKLSVPHLLPYSSAKFAEVGFSEGLHAELAGTGVSVTTVVPGLMRTGSFVNAEMKGKPAAEGTWFGLSSSVPFVSQDAEAAARRIVRAVQRRETELILGLPANVAARAHAMAPGLSQHLQSGAARLMSAMQAEEGVQEGIEATRPIWKPPLSLASTLGRRSVRRFQPVDDETVDRLEAG